MSPMSSASEWDGFSDDDYKLHARRSKRRKTINERHSVDHSPDLEDPNQVSIIIKEGFYALLESVEEESYASFEPIIEESLPDLFETTALTQEELSKEDLNGKLVIPISRSQGRQLIDTVAVCQRNTASAIILRRLQLHPSPLRAGVLGLPLSPLSTTEDPITPLAATPPQEMNPQVIDTLYAIRSTPYENSFISRLQGFQPSRKSGVLAVDWDNRTPWMDLMRDIRDHFSLMHPGREQPVEVEAPIEYTTLVAAHLPQVHELLGRSFWDGIDVSDSLHYSPEQCTVVAMYKNLVVGIALLSSPQETYITYLVVKSGWDNSQIATSMLYHLIILNPNKDITLHVSITNPAMLLYNRFGFKAEEFIVGFYEDYLDPQSRRSRNAFRLRLRQ